VTLHPPHTWHTIPHHTCWVTQIFGASQRERERGKGRLGSNAAREPPLSLSLSQRLCETGFSGKESGGGDFFFIWVDNHLLYRLKVREMWVEMTETALHFCRKTGGFIWFLVCPCRAPSLTRHVECGHASVVSFLK
jgi:hypothetical protein